MKKLSTLKIIIPPIEMSAENVLSGGFVNIKNNLSSYSATDLNCPNKGTCSGTADYYVDNVNCPYSNMASCSGSASSSENVNCRKSNLCGQTTPDTTESTSAGINNITSPFMSLLF